MIFGSFFKSPRNRQFTYQPRFYNEDKEHREQLVRSLEEAEKARSEGKYVPNIRGRIGRRRGRPTPTGPFKSGSLLLLVIKLALVMGIIYMGFKLLDRIYG